MISCALSLIVQRAFLHSSLVYTTLVSWAKVYSCACIQLCIGPGCIVNCIELCSGPASPPTADSEGLHVLGLVVYYTCIVG